MFDSCCEKSNYRMSSAPNVILRVTIVLGMMVAVMAVLYFTPLPVPYFKSCDRPCHNLDWPMICRVKISLETPDDFRHCEDCISNRTKFSEVITINGEPSGPSIQICQNDILIVDVVNKIPGHSVTVHWRGQPNQDAPFMDGVPLVTQCPISSYTTFQYKVKVTAPGTHFYHAFSDRDRAQGVFGGLVVRRSLKIDPLNKHYDVDSKSHLILVSSSYNKLQLNGKDAASSIFDVIKNRRYRFRLAYTGHQANCPVTVSVDSHLIKVIALDGNPVSPLEVDSVTLSKGERVDFVLKTSREVNDYFLRVKSCNDEVLGLVSYHGDKKALNEIKKDGRRFDTGICESQLNRVCVTDVRSLDKIPEELQNEADKVMYLTVGSRRVNFNDQFSSKVYGINNLTFTYPSSPLLTQLDQVSIESVCDEVNIPENCRNKDVCSCVHVEFIPSGSSTEIILINQDVADEEHVFHLHGYRFYLVGSRQFNKAPPLDEIKRLDRQNALFKRNFNNPVLKDTIRVAGNSAVALRFLANNPGFWMLRDENSKGWTRGMDIVFQVGEPGEMAATPSEFPTCGNYLGPDFLLM